MKEVKLKDVKLGQKFADNDEIYYKTNETCDDICFANSQDVIKCYDIKSGYLTNIDQDNIVNLHWWEALKNPTKIEIMQAYEDGAEIQFKFKNIHSQGWTDMISTNKEPVWDWNCCSYRIKPSTHTIKIDDKEIEISEESYNKLKESLV